MKITNTEFQNVFLMEYASYNDNRGEFVKTIHDETFKQHGLDYQFPESFYSISKKNVIRGMHFQRPPADHAKLVYVITGSIIDVILDIRTNSETFGRAISFELSAKNRKGIYIGKGFAHGFLSLEDNTTVEYHTTTVQDKESEGGIKYDSFNFDWGILSPIVSERDLNFKSLAEIQNPF